MKEGLSRYSRQQSATGGTGALKSPVASNVLGNYQMKMVNKAFENF